MTQNIPTKRKKMKVNGEFVKLESSDLSAFLENLNYKIELIAVELNGKILSRDEILNTTLKDSDVLEVVSFVGGG